jgi:hypothetical protein
VQGRRLPAAIRERLGHEGTLALLDVLDSAQETWSDRVLSVAVERFECRLAQESSKLRVEFHDGLTSVRQEMATTRVELLKWSFLFWVGQVAAMAGLLAYMLPRT